jgi:hypothetical protein
MKTIRTIAILLIFIFVGIIIIWIGNSANVAPGQQIVTLTIKGITANPITAKQFIGDSIKIIDPNNFDHIICEIKIDKVE